MEEKKLSTVKNTTIVQVTEVTIKKENISKAELLRCFEQELSQFDDNTKFERALVMARFYQP
ncbi:MAG: hypothetical protein Q4F84_08620 [Fibrobacter sp.]|nr:hypothetical protein [Fibrobacter sp.]